jgi:hypothetical protein
MLTGNNLQKSTNRGDSWTLIQTHGLEHAGIPLALAIDPVHPGLLYIGTQRSFSDDVLQRLWRSDDGGVHWRAWGAAMPPTWEIDNLLIDPQEPTLLYAAVKQNGAPPTAAAST